MQSYVYQRQIPYTKKNLLVAIKSVVREIRDLYPELETCTLADVGVSRAPQCIDLTLYFKDQSS